MSQPQLELTSTEKEWTILVIKDDDNKIMYGETNLQMINLNTVTIIFGAICYCKTSCVATVLKVSSVC